MATNYTDHATTHDRGSPDITINAVTYETENVRATFGSEQLVLTDGDDLPIGASYREKLGELSATLMAGAGTIPPKLTTFTLAIEGTNYTWVIQEVSEIRSKGAYQMFDIVCAEVKNP